jgi:glycosyltransferase involved in cell wall biosynthesis
VRKLRLAVITPEFVTEPYFSGGVAFQLFRLMRALRERGNEVHIFTQSDHDEAPFEHDGLQVHRVAPPQPTSPWRKWPNRLTRHRLPHTLGKLGFSWRVHRRLGARHRLTPFDLVFAASYEGCGVLTALLSRLPVVTQIASFRPWWNAATRQERTLDLRLSEKIEILQCKWSSHVYGPTRVIRDALEQEAGITGVEVIRTPIYLETTTPDPGLYAEHLAGKSYFLFFGRYQLHKGFHILAQALPRILAALPEAHAVFVGKDMRTALADSMEDYAREQAGPYADRLRFFGETRHEQLYPLIEHARLVVLPSLVDNLPNTLLESLALGRPVVGTIGASFDEVLTDGVDGFLVPREDPDALAEKVIAAWQHEDLEAIGRRAREKAAEFAPEKTVEQLLACFERVLEARA